MTNRSPENVTFISYIGWELNRAHCFYSPVFTLPYCQAQNMAPQGSEAVYRACSVGISAILKLYELAKLQAME